MSMLDRLAVIEIGTRGIRLLVVERRALPEAMEVLRSRGELGNLGAGLDRNAGRMSAENIGACLDHVRRFLTMALSEAPDRIVLVGTHVLRRAGNVDELRALLPEPLCLHVLTPEEEAAGSFLAACWGLRRELPDIDDLVVIDLGGGSLEVVHGLPGHPPAPLASASLGTMGTLALREAWSRLAGSSGPAQGLRDYIDAELARHAGEFAAFRHLHEQGPAAVERLLVAGLGSAVTASAWLLTGRPLETYRSKDVNGLRVARPELERLRAELLEKARPNGPLAPAIAEEIQRPIDHQLGLAALLAVMAAMGAPAITACGTGLRFGLAYSLLHDVPLAIAKRPETAPSDASATTPRPGPLTRGG